MIAIKDFQKINDYEWEIPVSFRRGLWLEAGSLAGLAEEAPQAYKDVDEVV